MLKRYLLLFTALFFVNICFAQDTIQIKRKLSGHVTEIFKVLKSDVNTRQGSFRAVYKNKIPVPSGMYVNDKKVGLWRFTDPNGVILQTYDYTYKRLFYEAPEDTTSHFRYLVDKELKEGDKVTKPIKIGGRFYGYLPYLTLFTLPNEFKTIDRDDLSAVVELLISPGGRLADFKVELTAGVLNQPLTTINMNIKLPDPADLVFTPATQNGEPIASRIRIRCVVNSSWHLDFE
ncbi:hypothetical protein EWM62_17820 [Mucilaginibacter terrigena]|uniref:Uncharacterized protein n=1 Tax=Mucilaginibacter terrigena TaxID=2492395 RepID=A0A4Q5LHD7_9SPHI|nr:hypothetical protein [Mucilaginibacter terrigena]RYU86513.1 hypothetical protein EWM62_17820 [Mucilaginibacter terrigena]